MQTTAQDTPTVTESISSFYTEALNRVRNSFQLDKQIHSVRFSFLLLQTPRLKRGSSSTWTQCSVTPSLSVLAGALPKP